MVFSSTIFLLLFLPLFLFSYFFADKKYKNIVILVFSIIFYSWGAPKFIFVILGSTFIDFHLVKWMAQSQNEQKRKILLAFSVGINLGLLIYFKYSNFFIDNLNAVIQLFGFNEISWAKLILPIGISFYTFETITYVVDVYRRVHKPLNNFWDYQTYIILFPKLIAGPIIRYHDLAGQITDRSENETLDNKLIGMYRFILGLSKKVLIANYLAGVADEVFSSSFESMDSYTAWIGILAYTFQIYFDFAGYSDMAIGIGQMIGFKFPENFNNPYASQSITEFWRRWHITLGSWMRNYLYIPLGGNRVTSKRRLYLNLWLVFLASGLWHGASWNFIFWGAFHGLFLVLERQFLNELMSKTHKYIRILLTFFIVMIAWVFFRLETFTEAIDFLKAMFRFQIPELFVLEFKTKVLFAFAIFFGFFTVTKRGEKIQEAVYFGAYSNKKHFLFFTICSALLLISIGSIIRSDFNPFIYFRF